VADHKVQCQCGGMLSVSAIPDSVDTVKYSGWCSGGNEGLHYVEGTMKTVNWRNWTDGRPCYCVEVSEPVTPASSIRISTMCTGTGPLRRR
jgi:hypothetical protein